MDQRKFSGLLQYATKAAPAFFGGLPLIVSACAKANQVGARWTFYSHRHLAE